jgi:hypothetical protein
MVTSRILVESYEQRLQGYIAQEVLNDQAAESFLPQQRCYAAKHGFFLRRTVKLDPVAEYYIYDIVYRNRGSFRSDHRNNRRSYGYRFRQGSPISPNEAYSRFRLDTWMGGFMHAHSLTTDVATYFNAIYHHDLVNCVRALGWASGDVSGFGRFLRETNSGRSVDCLPQGIHPAKALGAEFLRFIDDSHRLRSDLILRFMDDIHLFDDDPSVLESDLLILQSLLGERGLSLSTSKTFFDEGDLDIENEVDEIRRDLLRRRGEVVAEDYGDEQEAPDREPGAADGEGGKDEFLTEEQVRYLLGLIVSPDVEESDAELVLRLLGDHGDDVFPHMLRLLSTFPRLAKNVYSFLGHVARPAAIAEQLLEYLADSPRATEFQLFWIVQLASEYLSGTAEYGSIVMAAFDHPNATVLTRAKVLEIGDTRFGLTDLREEQLRAGRSDWVGWAAAVGTRCLPRGNRNHLLGYFSNASSLNHLIAGCVRDLPDP